MIVGRWCRFHMCTEIGGLLVSTVGAYVHPRHSQGSEVREAAWLGTHWPGEDIGYNRKFETMVFAISGYCKSKKCGCGQPTIDPEELYADGCNDLREARQMHMKVCEKVANGEISRPERKEKHEQER